jgi:hypothetical protein
VIYSAACFVVSPGLLLTNAVIACCYQRGNNFL